MISLMNAVLSFLLTFGVGVSMDLISRRRDRRKTHKHSWTKWEFQYEIHNGNDVWERKCLKCGFTEVTVSKLIPKS